MTPNTAQPVDPDQIQSESEDQTTIRYNLSDIKSMATIYSDEEWHEMLIDLLDSGAVYLPRCL